MSDQICFVWNCRFLFMEPGVDLLFSEPLPLHQLLPSEATGGERALVAGIKVGSSTGQTLFQPTPEREEVEEEESQGSTHPSPRLVTTTSRFLPLEMDSR